MKSKKVFLIKGRKKEQPVIPSADKANFPDYMRMEIFTQPQRVNSFLKKYINAEKIDFDYLKIKIEKIKRIYIVGSGEDYGTVLAGAYNFEVLVDIPCIPVLLSEFNYSNPILDKNTLAIIISESRSNAQYMQAEKRVNDSGARLISILNYDSQGAFTVSLDFTAGSAVSTAACTLRYIALSLLALYFGEKNQVITELYIKIATKMLLTLSDKIKHVLENEFFIRHLTEKINLDNLILTGTNVDFAAAINAARLLSFALNRNISAVPIGEIDCLKGGEFSIIAFASSESFYDLLCKSVHNGVAVLPQNINAKNSNSISYDDTIPLLNPILSMIVIQLIAYHLARKNGIALDKAEE